MGESLIESIKKDFELKDIDIKTYSPLSLAYIGDSIYALLVKSIVVGGGNCQSSKFHNATVKYVSAVGQANMYSHFLDEDLLTDEEADVMRRGRSAKSHHSAKNASIEDYRMATGLETLFGWLYLRGDTNRMLKLLKLGMIYIDNNTN